MLSLAMTTCPLKKQVKFHEIPLSVERVDEYWWANRKLLSASCVMTAHKKQKIQRRTLYSNLKIIWNLGIAYNISISSARTPLLTCFS